ncbi:acyltransferase family protein [Paludibacter sp.]|uniref:acyltransferase n=1 Tax=Paludibacter sp. TaxID=1898105 RepID=UPI001353D6CF|nr:acyltransferase family protein [Paludibacter sp.]MTK53744.1 acyltransferase family protein [Paludibacter sp.]
MRRILLFHLSGLNDQQSINMHHLKKKFVWANDLRALATVSVIILHVSSEIVNKYGDVPQSEWWIGNVFDSLVRFCVPVFLMLTGALILPKTYKLGEFFKKRITRILLPFLFWSLIYIAYKIYLKREHGIEMDFWQTYSYMVYQLKTGASYHLWYVYMLIGIYLIIPLVSKWIVNSSGKEIFYYIIVWICVLLFNLPGINPSVPNIDFTYFSGYLGYPILGYLLAYKIEGKRVKTMGLLLFIIGVIITMIGTYLSSENDGNFNGYFYTYLSPNVIITSSGIFVFIKHYYLPLGKFRLVTNLIGKYSFGIYLSHVFILTQLSDAGFTASFINPLIGIPCVTIVCLLASFIVTFLLSKIPLVKHVSG